MKKLFLYMGILILVACNFLFAQPAPIRTMFLWQLLDTPNTYTGQADKVLQVNAGATAIEFTSLSDFITLGTHTSGNYIATITDAGNSVITVTGSGSESATITLDITDSGIVEADLKAVDSATDEDIFTYESTTGDFEWHTIVQMLALTDTDSLSEGSTNLYANTEEEIEDIVGGMLGGTETDITVTYQDATNDIDFVVTSLVDIVTTSPLTVNAGANLDDVIVGSDADITLAVTVLKDLVTTAPVTGGTNDIFTGADADITVALDFTASWDFGGASGFELPNAAAPTTNAAGEIALDTTITDHQPLWQYYDGGENMTLIAIDTAELPALDNEIVKYDAGTDKFVLEVDASAGTTAYDDIANPDAAGSISFDDTETATYTTVQDTAGSFISFINSNADVSNQVYMLDLDYSADTTQDNADFIRLQDASSTLVVFEEEGKITMTPSGVDDTIIISIIPSAALTQADAVWCGILIDGDAVDPGDVDNVVLGIDIDLSGVDLTNNPYVEALELIMPTGGVALHIEEGKIKQEFTSGSDAGAEYTAIDMFMDASNQAANSETHAIDVAVVGGDPAGVVVGIGTHTYVAPVHQHIGVFSIPDQAGADSEAGFFDNSATNYIDGVDGIEQFTANDDAIWISAATVFTEIEVIMGTPATRSITPTFWYWKDLGVDAWTEFFPADDTDGFQQSGTIRFETAAVTDWLSADVVNISAGDAGEAAAGYWIAIIRTVNADPGTPTPTTVKTGAITEFFWDETGAIDVLSIEADTITEGGVAVYNDNEIDEFSELNTIVADKTLVNEEDTVTWDNLHTFGGDVTIDDNSANSPNLTFIDEDNNTFIISKQDTGETVLRNNEGAIHLRPSGDLNDYLSISTTSHIVTITSVASGDGDLVITAGGGDISFGDENLTTTGTFKAGLLHLSTTAGITASTNQNQGQGALTTNINEVSICANGNDVVTLPTAVAGLAVYVFNNGAQILQVFPASGDDLGAGVNTSETVAATKNVMYIAYDATNWEKSAQN